MPKCTLQFNLPDEQNEFTLATHGSDFYCAIWEVQNYMRHLRKYDEREMVPKEEIIEKVYELLANLPEVE